MTADQLHVGGKEVGLHGCVVNPDFRAPRVLSSDPWDFVSLWLKRESRSNARFYWDQAKEFYNASSQLPGLSAPLTYYYCFLNATKALLAAKGIDFKESHGVGGRSSGRTKSLGNEIVDFRGSGILPALCDYLSEYRNEGKSLSMKQLMWEMPFIHRAYKLTFRSETELFIPLVNCQFIRRRGSREAWFQAELHRKYLNAHTSKVIRPGFELREEGGKVLIRRRRRFRWHGHDIEGSLDQFRKYHRQIRRRIAPIYTNENRWYLKKTVKGGSELNNSQLVLIYACMHRLSELSRYEPMTLDRHFSLNHNWLISEFIRGAPGQFVHGMASEITGLEFIRPDSF